MLFVHAELRKHVLGLEDAEIDELLLGPASEIEVDNLIKKLKKLDEMTKKLSRADATTHVACA